MDKKVDRKDVFNYLIKEHFKNDLDQVEKLTGYTQTQIEKWRTVTTPRTNIIDKMIQCTVVPEFKIIMEFESLPLSSDNGNLHGFLRGILGDYNDAPGIYSFYDAMYNILYIGKTNNKLSTRMYDSLNDDIGVTFPKDLQNTPKKRLEVVRYVSAYHISAYHAGKTSSDYPKHVESLILRILRMAKPPLNANDGKLRRIRRNAEYPESGMRTRTNARRKKRT